MIDLKLVQKQPEVLAKALADRQSPLKVDEFLELDGRRRGKPETAAERRLPSGGPDQA